jgi:outer membrane protein OmpA-like peptidoglycan-associated protein
MLKKIFYSLLFLLVTSFVANSQTAEDEIMPWDQQAKGKDKPKKEKKAAKPPKVKNEEVAPEMEEEVPETEDPEADKPAGYSPGSGFEVGLRGGLFQILGEIKRGSPDSIGAFSNYGFAGSLRFALDNIFSLRAEFLYGKAAGNSDGLNPSLRGFTSTWMSGSMWGLINLNSLASADKEKKLAINLMVGGGANSSTVSKYGTIISRPTEAETTTKKFDFSNNPFHVGAGLNLAYRVSPNLSIGLEHQTMMAMGERRDLLDGWDNGLENPAASQTDYNDYIGFTNLSLNYIIGNKTGDSPAFWNSPLKNVIREIEGIKTNMGTGGKIPIQDTDNDGVLDEFDLELNTPPNALVDTRGRTLDSDKDGVPDYLDKQPFYAPLEGEQVDKDGQIVSSSNSNNSGGAGEDVVVLRPGGGGVTEARVKEIVEQAFQQREATGGAGSYGGGAVVEWFLPMIHFEMSSSNIRTSDIGNLSSIARMMKSNRGMKLLVIGYTDKTGGEDVNQKLSFQRANAAIDYFVNKQGISRDRFVLNYKGKDDNIVEANSSFMNRRVEFQVAKPGDTDMPAPAGN